MHNFSFPSRKTDDITKFYAIIATVAIIAFCYILFEFGGPARSPCLAHQQEIMIYSTRDIMIMCK